MEEAEVSDTTAQLKKRLDFGVPANRMLARPCCEARPLVMVRHPIRSVGSLIYDSFYRKCFAASHCRAERRRHLLVLPAAATQRHAAATSGQGVRPAVLDLQGPKAAR